MLKFCLYKINIRICFEIRFVPFLTIASRWIRYICLATLNTPFLRTVSPNDRLPPKFFVGH